MKLEEVHFNHDASAATADAITIRRNVGGSPIAAPEWRDGQPPQPAAYARNALGGQVTIKARFSGGPPNETVLIRAIDAYLPPAAPGGCLGWLLGWIISLLRALFGNILGDVSAKTVHFDGAGNSGLETFVLINHKLKTSGVGIRTTDWTWQRRHGHGPWTTFGTSHHKIYLVLDIPKGPWSQAGGNNTQLPWTDALDKSCVWAFGATTTDEAAAKITAAVNGQKAQTYTPATIFGFGNYMLTSYLGQLNGGSPFQLNCTDCADAVTTFSNLLGCDLWEGRFFNMVTRRFLTLSGNPANDPDWVSWSWGYHEICWLGSVGPNEMVYDGCLQLDMDNNDADTVHIAQLPVKMHFGSTLPTDYRFRLIASGAGTLENIPRRRAVV